MEAAPMKLIVILSTAVLSLTLGIAAPLYAQQEQRDQQQDQKGKPAQVEEKHAPPEGQRAQQDKSAKQEEKTAQEQDKNSKQEEKTAQQQDKNARQEEHNAQQHTQETRTEQVRYNGRIPEDRFRANFGSVHVFVINRPVIVEGHPRFQYGGYWFGFGEPWPGGWAYTDNVYVDYMDGGYYLYNRVHPGVRISINIF